MSDDIPEDSRQQIADAIFAENKILAIKRYREATGQGLAESKEFIEKLSDELREKSPEKFKPLQNSAGCGSSVLFFLAALGGIAYYASTVIG